MFQRKIALIKMVHTTRRTRFFRQLFAASLVQLQFKFCNQDCCNKSVVVIKILILLWIPARCISSIPLNKEGILVEQKQNSVTNTWKLLSPSPTNATSHWTSQETFLCATCRILPVLCRLCNSVISFNNLIKTEPVIISSLQVKEFKITKLTWDSS